MTNKHPLVVWSGGVDSTGLIINLFASEIPFETVYVKLPNNETQQKYELAARKKILKKLTEIFGNYHLKDTEVEYVGSLSNAKNELSQPFIWATSISYYMDLSSYSEVQFGYIREDDFWHFKQSFEELLHISQKILRPSDKLAINIVYPLEWSNKVYMIEKYYKCRDDVFPVLDMTYYCESGKKKPCGECKKCKELKKAHDEIAEAANDKTNIQVSKPIKKKK